jgi:hypothetical protein
MAVTAVVHDTTFDVTLTGWDRVWAFKGHLSVPIDQITRARVVERKGALKQLRWRVGGTYLPGVVCAGHYTLRSGPGRAFAFAYRAPEILEVATKLERPRLVLLQHPDCHDLAWFLGERIG